MRVDLSPLLSDAFLTADALYANEALTEAREIFAVEPGAKSFNYEVLVPEEPDRNWLEKQLLPKLVYFCESSRSPLPHCAGVFVSLFIGEKLYCVAASRVVAYGGLILGLNTEELVARFGTGESRVPLRPPAGLLEGEDA